MVFLGDSADFGRRRAVDAGLQAAAAHAGRDLPEAAEILRRELREGDLVLLTGRTTDHMARLLFAQVGDVACQRARCPKPCCAMSVGNWA